MDQELISKLAELGPWGLAVAAVALLRRELAAIIHAPKNDRGLEDAFKGFGEQLGRNLVLFEKTNQHLETIEDRLGDSNRTLQQVLAEMARRSR